MKNKVRMLLVIGTLIAAIVTACRLGKKKNPRQSQNQTITRKEEPAEEVREFSSVQELEKYAIGVALSSKTAKTGDDVFSEFIHICLVNSVGNEAEWYSLLPHSIIEFEYKLREFGKLEEYESLLYKKYKEKVD